VSKHQTIDSSLIKALKTTRLATKTGIRIATRTAAMAITRVATSVTTTVKPASRETTRRKIDKQRNRLHKQLIQNLSSTKRKRRPLIAVNL